jgi:hypothetical protein
VLVDRTDAGRLVSTIPTVLGRIEAAFDSRGRRTLLSLVAAAVLTAGVLATLNRETSGAPATTPAHKLPTIAQVEQQKFGDQITPSRKAIGTARDFIANVVLRKDLAAGWPDITPKLRGESMTREQWLSGSIPVVPYSAKDFGKAGIQIVRARQKSILLLVLITPKKGSTARQQDYFLELVPAEGRWLVNYWAPKGRLDAPVPLANP